LPQPNTLKTPQTYFETNDPIGPGTLANALVKEMKYSKLDGSSSAFA
jgi:hypothetical protein